MDKYLVIITTVLVVTQIIRLVQNTILLLWQKRQTEAQLASFDDITIDDVRQQKEAFRLIVKYLREKMGFGPW